MDSWARQYDGRANFVCVGCGGQQLSESMGKQMRLSSCVNSFIEKQTEMPRWGQLGCSGFIVLGQDGSVVNECTSAYLQVRESAFRHVETILDSLLADQPTPSVYPGVYVRLAGLKQQPALNGQLALCVLAADADSGRCEVVLMSSGKRLRLRATNVEPVNEAEQLQAEETMRAAAAASKAQAPASGGWGTGGGCGDPCAAPTIEGVPSVLVPEMDDEHEHCVAALNALGEKRTAAALQDLLATCSEHFEHEEAMLDKFLYADAVGAADAQGFDMDANARRSHFADHKRILDAMHAALDAATDSCQKIPVDVVKQLMEDFAKHADSYDGPYAERLEAALGSEKAECNLQ